MSLDDNAPLPDDAVVRTIKFQGDVNNVGPHYVLNKLIASKDMGVCEFGQTKNITLRGALTYNPLPGEKWRGNAWEVIIKFIDPTDERLVKEYSIKHGETIIWEPGTRADPYFVYRVGGYEWGPIATQVTSTLKLIAY